MPGDPVGQRDLGRSSRTRPPTQPPKTTRNPRGSPRSRRRARRRSGTTGPRAGPSGAATTTSAATPISISRISGLVVNDAATASPIAQSHQATGCRSRGSRRSWSRRGRPASAYDGDAADGGEEHRRSRPGATQAGQAVVGGVGRLGGGRGRAVDVGRRAGSPTTGSGGSCGRRAAGFADVLPVLGARLRRARRVRRVGWTGSAASVDAPCCSALGLSVGWLDPDALGCEVGLRGRLGRRLAGSGSAPLGCGRRS